MIKKYLIAVLLGVVTFPAMAQDDKADPATPATVSVGENFVLTSKILSEDRPYSVYLPEACKPETAKKPCPILYILDGPSHFFYAAGMLQHMAGNGQILETIMVAVPNTADRSKDLTPTHTALSMTGEPAPEFATSGGGEPFLDFLEKELIPEVEARYHPMPFRILSGHSLGGLIALHSFVERPKLFQAYIAVDPSLWWDDMELVKRAEAKLAASNDYVNKVFMTVAEHAPRGDGSFTTMETGAERFGYAMKASPSPRLKSAVKQYFGHDHGTVPFLSLYDGMLFVFDGYKNPPPSVTSKGLSSVEDYYHGYLGEYGVALSPPAAVIGDMAQMADQRGDTETYLAYMKYNLDAAPDSPMAMFMLAMAYDKVGKKDLALPLFQHALELAPTFATYIQPKIDAITKGD